MPSDIKKRDKPSCKGSQEYFQEHLREELFELIKSNFPRLDPADISRAAEQFAEFDRAELEMLLHPGKFITKKGKRVQEAYIRAAPIVYKLTNPAKVREGQYDLKIQYDPKNQNDLKDQIGQTGYNFNIWLSIVSKASELSFSCLEGLLNSSALILEKKGLEGLPLLGEWTEMGISLAKKNNLFAMIYFNHTAGIVASSGLFTDMTSTSFSGDISTDSRNMENFREFISFGEKFAGSNAKVAEAYFEHLPDMLALFSLEDLQFFYSIIERLLNGQWAVAVEVLNLAKDVFSSIPPQRRKELLIALNESADPMRSFPDRTNSHMNNHTDNHTDRTVVTFALFRNAPQVMAELNDKDFRVWASIAEKISNISADAAVSFLSKSSGVLMFLKIDELQQWAEKGINFLFSEKQAFESYFESSFRGLEKHLQLINSEERELLLDTGSRIVLINPGCADNYFENSPAALRMLSGNEFMVWVDVGARISKESSSLGSVYFKNSVASFRKISLSYYGEMLEIAESLLEKDWLLAGKFFESLPEVSNKIGYRDIRKWAEIGTEVYDADRNLAVDYFTYSPVLLTELDVFKLEEWVLKGLNIFKDNIPLGRPYFSLKSRSSKDSIDELTGEADLLKVANILRYYAMGLSGIVFKVRSKKELPVYNETGPVNPVISGRTIYLEPRIKKYGNFQDNFKIYKLSVMHEVGHAQFSSSKLPSEALKGLVNQVIEKYRHEETGAAERAEWTEKKNRILQGILSKNIFDVSAIIAIFPNRVLAASIFGVLEDARVEYLIMDLYRGVRSDLESIRYQMLLERPVPEGDLDKLMETLLWLSASHEPPFKFTEDNWLLLDAMQSILQKQILKPDSSILNSLEATFAIYSLFENLLGTLEDRKYEMFNNIEYRGMGPGSFSAKSSLPNNHKDILRRFIPESENQPAIEKGRHEKEKTDREELQKEKSEKKPVYATERKWKVLGNYRYDEWDYVINDYRSDWCIVNEIEPVGGSGEYYVGASRRYSNEIALIKNVFTRMKPESFHRLKGQTDGTEIDIDALSDALIERRCGINPDERLYIRWDKRKRDVATLFLVDVSASTRKRLRSERGNTGERRDTGKSGTLERSIIDVEKDALVIMAQALETIGDRYAIHAFSGHTKESVEYYIIKEFDEELSGNVEQRIGLLEPVANTRLGPAIRHSIKKLEQVNASTKILILLSDGEPYDTCYGEGAYQGKYAEEDTKIAILEGNSLGIHFFCITVDSSPGDYLENIFSDFGYTIIDDARSLPESLPLLYKRITT